MNKDAFSLSHDWEVHWRRLPSYRPPRLLGTSDKEESALHAVASIGVIGGLQLARMFSTNRRKAKNKIKKMAREWKVVRHEVEKNNQTFPVYSIGSNGARIADIPNYRENYWVEYRVEDVLKRLLFFQFSEKFPGAEILPAPKPFVGMLSFRNRHMYVYVVRGDMKDFLMFLKWEKFPGRMLVITESLDHLAPLNIYAPDLQIRVTTDADLRGEFEHLFYKWDGDSWVKENEQAVVSE